MSDILDLLLSNLDAAYSRKGWHGTNLLGSLRGLKVKDVYRRPAPGRHNIWELVAHAAYWKYAARRRLTDGKRGSFSLKGSNWIAASKEDEAAWREVLNVLASEHQLLRDAIAAQPGSVLRDPKKLRLIYGVAAHDVYHTAQIQLTKRLIA